MGKVIAGDSGEFYLLFGGSVQMSQDERVESSLLQHHSDLRISFPFLPPDEVTVFSGEIETWKYLEVENYLLEFQRGGFSIFLQFWYQSNQFTMLTGKTPPSIVEQNNKISSRI